MRRPIGRDRRRRRYWALGGAAGAWRLFVESDEGRSWGWYDGCDVPPLLEWLRKGDNEVEGPLLAMLVDCPLGPAYQPPGECREG